jgi:hypothetical protein
MGACVNPAARRGVCGIVMALVGTALCTVASTARAAGEALYLTADFGKTTYGGELASYDTAASERLAGIGVNAALAQSNLDRKYTQHRPRSYGLRWQSRYTGFEVGYFNLGRATYAATGQASEVGGPVNLTTDMTVKSRGPALSLLGVLPLGRAWQLEVRGGGYYGRNSTTWSATKGGFDTGTYSDKNHEFSTLAGSALVVDIGGQSALSLGYTRFFDVANRRIERLSLGVSVVLREP